MFKIFEMFQRAPYLIPLIIAIGVTPILYIPWFSDAYEVHKATVIVLAAMISGIIFIARIMRDHKMHILWSRTHVFTIALFLATVLSALFSRSPTMSWLGLGGGDYASVLFVGACVLTTFLLAQVSDFSHSLFTGIRALWTGEAVLMGVILGGIFLGFVPLLSSLAFGVPHALALFFSIVALLWAGELSGNVPHKGVQLLGVVLFVVLFAITFMLDAWILWLPLMFSGVLLLSLTLAKVQGTVSISRIIPAILLIILSGAGWLLPPFFQGLFPAEIVPSFSLSVDIAHNVWSHGIGWLVGSGSGTYGISYVLHALPAVNETLFWNVTFERAASHILTLATTGGILTLSAFICIQICGVVAGYRAWEKASQERRMGTLGLYLAFLFLSFSAWTYAWNVPIVFIMFVILGLLLGAGPQKKITRNLATSTQASVITSFCFVISLVLCSLVFFVSGTRYAAEIAYAQAVSLSRQSASPEDVLAKLDRAASFNRWNDVYYRELSLLLLRRINDLVNSQASSEQIQAVLGASVNAAVRATEMNPNVVANWEVRGNVYREVAPAVANAADFSIASFITATQLAPNNPLYAVGLGRAYLAKADLLSQGVQSADADREVEIAAVKAEILTQAEEALLKAVKLKPNYTAARYFLSAVYEREGKLTDAVKSMEVVRALNVDDVGVGMQLALLYLRQGKNALAQAELERIVILSPTYANARWYLSVILEQAGDTDGAIAQIEEILKTNADNEAAQQRLVRLESGESADDVASIPEPLPEDSPLLEGNIPDDAGVL